MNNTANQVLNEIKLNPSIDAEQVLAKGIGKSDLEVQWFIDSAKELGLI